MKKYQYTVRKCFREITDLEYEDGDYSIFLSTSGDNDDEVPGELVKFLEYVHANLADSTKDFEDDYVRQLQESVVRIKKSREAEERYMVLEEMMQRERREGMLEGMQQGAKQGKVELIMLLLSSRFSVTAGLKEKLSEINSMERLEELFLAAVNAVSLHDFEKQLF